MGKNNKVAVEDVNPAEEVPTMRTPEELKEILQTLRVQLLEHQKQSEHHTTMAVKAQGAIEVISQLLPREEEGDNGGES